MNKAVLTLILALSGTGVAVAQTPARTMHDTYCIVCHDTKVYTRENRIATDYSSLRAEVNRWQSNISLRWSDEDIDAVTRLLAERYYGFNCADNC
jgi:hypothetical protein